MKLLFPLVLTLISLKLSLAYVDYAILDKTSESVGLSSWELYVFSDLMFQIALKKCPKVSRPKASYLKDYITESVKQVPQNPQQHAEFLPTYTKLMKCFDQLDKSSKIPGKKLESVRFINNPETPEDNSHSNKEQAQKTPETQGFKAVFIPDNDNSPASETILTPEEPDAPRLNHTWQDKLGEWHFEWVSKVANMFNNLLRPNRSALEPKGEIEKVASQKRITDQVRRLREAKNKLTNLLHELNRVVQWSCPAELKPDANFSRMTIADLFLGVQKTNMQ